MTLEQVILRLCRETGLTPEERLGAIVAVIEDPNDWNPYEEEISESES